MKKAKKEVAATSVAANDNQIRFLSVCSGIEAASVAWKPLGWKAIGFAEIEKFPSAVLKHHYPDVPNFGDFTKIDTTKLGHVDIFCGGTPCQAFSVAGLRGSLSDERGNLTLEFVRLAHELANGNGLRNAVWENVPGVLNTPDNAFGCFLAGLVGSDDALHPPGGGKWPDAGMVAGPLGRTAWRVLDAQFFGLAQRRRRVIAVSDFGNGADPAAVLFERKSLSGHFAPSRKTGQGASGFPSSGIGSYGESPISGSQRAAGGDTGKGGETLVRDIAPTLSARTKGGGGLGTDFDLDGGLVPANDNIQIMAHGQGGAEIGVGRSPTLTCNHEAPIAIIPQDENFAIQERAVSENLENGPQGKGYQPDIAYTLEARNKVQAVSVTGNVSHALPASHDASEDGSGRGVPTIAYGQPVDTTGHQGDRVVGDGDIHPSLSAQGGNNGGGAGALVATSFAWQSSFADEGSEEISGTLIKNQTMAVAIRGREGGGTAEVGGEVSNALRASSVGGDKSHVLTFQQTNFDASHSEVSSTLTKEGMSGTKGGSGAEALVMQVAEVAPTLGKESFRPTKSSSGQMADFAVGYAAHVRRLTPMECERLQGFQWLCAPDYPGAWQDHAGRWWSPEYTNIPWRGKPNAPDGPRYKSLGNSWAVPKFMWVGERIARLLPANDNDETTAAA